MLRKRFHSRLYENNSNSEKNKMNLAEKDFVQYVTKLIKTDRFSQILIQRLLINISSIN